MKERGSIERERGKDELEAGIYKAPVSRPRPLSQGKGRVTKANSVTEGLDKMQSNKITLIFCYS